MAFPLFSIQAVMIVALVLIIHMNRSLSYSNANSSDYLALLEIKSKITNDHEGVLRSWNDSLPFCAWQGVTCGRRHQRVTILNLAGKGLVGSLSPYLGNLSFLRYLVADNNKLHGSIPFKIVHLYRLHVLSLYNNSLTGEIPSNMSSWPKLSYLNLELNKLSGKIPNTFSSMLMINVLSFAKNCLTGGIPSSMGNLTSLEVLTLSDNPLRGSIPNSFHQLKNLQTLGLGEDHISGAFPLFLFNLSMLKVLSLPENQLHGSLPLNLCLSQPHLQVLVLGTNHLNGYLPHAVANCSEMQILDVGNNDFTGDIAIDFRKLQYLRMLILGPNNFVIKYLDGMRFLDSLSNCSNLEALELFGSKLYGVLPNSIGNFSSKLAFLGMDSNSISGNIPSSIGNLLGLTTLYLSVNNFTGMIPVSIGKLHNLQILYLDMCQFSGVIPRSIGNLTRVIKLALGGNKLEGSIPSTIGNCKMLIGLDIQGNNLSGSIPIELFQLSSLSIGLDLSKNNLSGVLPQEIGNLKVLGLLDLSQNHFSGELPNSLSNCISLQTINLSGNFFYGSIPEAFSSLKGLEYVDLSRNNFSGQIPTYFQQIPLKHLDLAYDNFEGEVPILGVFSNRSAISVIGNIRLCGGIPELHLPKCTTTNRGSKRTRKLSLHFVVVISLSSIVAGLALVSFVLFYCCIKKKRDKQADVVLNKSLERISYGRLFKATEGFSSDNLVGIGSFASVYKGVLDDEEEDGLTVAIKVLKLQRRGGSKSFMAECDALRNIRHRNLVKVITSCSSIDFQGNEFKALVYDYMPNGSVESWLHLLHGRKLDLAQRINILKDVACAIDYLHCHCGNIIVHCDLKPSNILLDADMVAHVGDFGLAKILTFEEVSNANNYSSSIMKGTIGYAPPECGLGNEVSTSWDIYSYGVLLLEMLTGKKPVDPMFNEGLSLHSYAKSALAANSLSQILDPVLIDEDINEKSLFSLVKIGVKCSSQSPHDRKDIGTVVHELFSINYV